MPRFKQPRDHREDNLARHTAGDGLPEDSYNRHQGIADLLPRTPPHCTHRVRDFTVKPGSAFRFHIVCEIHSESEMCEMVDVTSKLLGGPPNPSILKRFTVKFTVKKQKNVVKSHNTEPTHPCTHSHCATDTRSKRSHSASSSSR